MLPVVPRCHLADGPTQYRCISQQVVVRVYLPARRLGNLLYKRRKVPDQCPVFKCVDHHCCKCCRHVELLRYILVFQEDVVRLTVLCGAVVFAEVLAGDTHAHELSFHACAREVG